MMELLRTIKEHKRILFGDTEKKKEVCKICGKETKISFNIKSKKIYICENCAKSIFIQQARWFVQQ